MASSCTYQIDYQNFVQFPDYIQLQTVVVIAIPGELIFPFPFLCVHTRAASVASNVFSHSMYEFPPACPIIRKSLDFSASGHFRKNAFLLLLCPCTTWTPNYLLYYALAMKRNNSTISTGAQYVYIYSHIGLFNLPKENINWISRK